jgi:TRAP-type uncharacterized transport system fused permease subunit
MSNSSLIIEYAKSTQNVCLCMSISAFLIILFMMTPLNSFILSSIIGKLIILLLLGYTIYYNITKTNKFANSFNIDMMSDSWDPVKTNIACSYVFSGFLLILMLTVLQKLFGF